jgi:hypothetical protein
MRAACWFSAAWAALSLRSVVPAAFASQAFGLLSLLQLCPQEARVAEVGADGRVIRVARHWGDSQDQVTSRLTSRIPRPTPLTASLGAAK